LVDAANRFSLKGDDLSNQIDGAGDVQAPDDPGGVRSHRRLRGSLGVWGIVFAAGAGIAARSPRVTLE
jgi:hypothetical protein